jgi:hypothetical protein
MKRHKQAGTPASWILADGIQGWRDRRTDDERLRDRVANHQQGCGCIDCDRVRRVAK